MDASDPNAPKIVHAFMGRAAEGYSIKTTWDVLGMRATQSEDTVLEGVFVPDDRVARVVPAGAAGIDAFVIGVFAWALLGFGNIYYGLARRAFDWTIETVKTKTSLAVSRSMAYHPEVQHTVAEMAMELEAIGPHLDRVSRRLVPAASTTAPRGASRSSRPSTGRSRARSGSSTSRSRSRAGSASSTAPVWSGMFRDARLGRIHPPTAASRAGRRRRRWGSTRTSSRAGGDRRRAGAPPTDLVPVPLTRTAGTKSRAATPAKPARSRQPAHSVTA